MRALLISAAPSAQSLTDDLARTADAELRAHGYTVDLLDLNELH
ncbi:hypothetical protein [Flexivirga sp.]